MLLPLPLRSGWQKIGFVLRLIRDLRHQPIMVFQKVIDGFFGELNRLAAVGNAVNVHRQNGGIIQIEFFCIINRLDVGFAGACRL